ncbi:cyclophilin-like protein [Venturia nashicola]|uniref:Peptidyl-prolyl cis-trans isomerase n=1 Tax=Venturia nashicola TaxID=86259 RepID=A0A4Z1NZY9_9PEZI|nr:cyclophilin-like protein [Venturia nashicola]TLD34892.1 cyclophilin-like protein [Venturia nashicola]
MSVTLHTTLGPIKVELYTASAPKTAENFLALCASNFYNSSPFHRIIPSFIVQTGAPSTDPKSKSSISVFGAPFEDEIRPALRHNARGVMSMANKGKDTNGSQFFFTLAPQPTLDGKNTVFGKVIDGWETLEKLETVEVDSKGRAKGKAPKIERVEIHANPMAG